MKVWGRSAHSRQEKNPRLKAVMEPEFYNYIFDFDPGSQSGCIEIRCRREACVCLFTSELWREDAAHFMSGETESSSVV